MKVSQSTYSGLAALFHVSVLVVFGLFAASYIQPVLDTVAENQVIGPVTADHLVVFMLVILLLGYAAWATDAIELKETDTP